MHQPTVGAALAAITKPELCALTRQTGLAVALASAASAQPTLSGDGYHATFTQPPSWPYAEGIGVPHGKDIAVDIWFDVAE